MPEAFIKGVNTETRTDSQVEVKLVIPPQRTLEVFGDRDSVLRRVEELVECEVVVRGNEIVLRGTEAAVERAEAVFDGLVGLAVEALNRGEASRIILTRPAVEAGESLGFLPGDVMAKVDPYFRPLYDALYEMVDPAKFQAHLERGIIEIAPLAYMRGRTLNDAFIILDEAQNTTPQQMKMFLTRLGFGSKMVVTGDITQVDLPTVRVSGLQDARNTLTGVEGVSFVGLRRDDIVRSDLVMRIVDAYEGAGEGDRA